MEPKEARRNALIKLGGLEAVKEHYRDQRGIPLVESLLQDLRYTFRTLGRSPGFAITALVSLGLGIGANSAIFTVASAALWRQLPVADPDSLVLVSAIREDGRERFYPPTGLADELGQLSAAFLGAATRTDDGLSFSFEGSRAERIVGEVVSPNYFSFLGIKPLLGRGFSDDVQSGHWAPEVVLSHRFWRQRLAGDPGILGRTILLNSYPFTVVGVTPPEFFGVVVGWDPELRLPMMPAGQTLSQMNLLSSPSAQIIARLGPAVSTVQAQVASDAVFERFLNDNPNAQLASNPMRHILIRPGNRGWQGDVSDFGQPLVILLVLAGLVLLIACANLANMLLARSTARRRELAVRAAIGAGRFRLLRQMLVESLLLSGLGAGIGFGLSLWVSRVLFGFLPQGHIALTLDVNPDARAVWFTAGISILTATILGLIPGVKATRGDLALSLKSDSAGSLGDIGGSKLRRGFVVGQVAMSVLLLALAGVFERSLGTLRDVNPFPQPEQVLLFTMKPQPELYDPANVLSLATEITHRVSALPGVQSAAVAENGPLGSRWRWGRSTIEGSSGQIIDAVVDSVSPGYLGTIGLPLVAGRDFSLSDTSASPRVVIINETLARLLFKDENPLGRRIDIAPGLMRSKTPVVPGNVIDQGYGKLAEIIGVARGNRYYDLHEGPQPAFFSSIQQDPAYMPTLHVRVSAGHSPAVVIRAVLGEFDSIDRGFPVFNIRTLGDRLDDSLARERLLSQLAAAFGVLALLLSLTGIYGVMAYSVTRREREIGLRTALGATSAAVLRMVFRESMILVALGIAAAVPSTLSAGLLVSSRMPGLPAVDLPSLGTAALLMLGVAALAGFLPARRAARLDPITALRCQ
jgi:predicted permease